MAEMQNTDSIRLELGVNGTYAFNSIDEVKLWLDDQKSFHAVLLRQDRKNPIPGCVTEHVERLYRQILLSNTHLHTDASERRTMMLTYLAMMRERQLPDDDSRRLILQALFRPSSTGIIKDDASPPFIAEWIRATVGKD